MTKTTTLETIFAHKVMAIVRLGETEKVQKVADALIEGGIVVLEVTLNTPDALTHIQEIRKRYGTQAVIGAGTVTDVQGCQDALAAGAEFIVTPICNHEIIRLAHQKEVPVFMGAMTPTEIHAAYKAGADVIKVFPAGILGMEYFKAVAGPLPQIPLMPTGGVSRGNAKEWLEKGAVALGVGSALTDKQVIANDDYQQLTDKARSFLDAVQV